MKIRIKMQDCSAALVKSVVTATLVASALLAAPAGAATLYYNGFETNTTGWTNATRVPSGSGGFPSSSGAWHATAAMGSGTFTQWGGYNYGAGNAVPTAFQEYRTSLDIYLNVGGTTANDTRFDWSSAINNSSGNHVRDFIFNGGFYNDTDASPGSGTSRFIISAGNNSQSGSAYAKNPGHDPFAISTSGWYSFEHHFYDNGGVLAVDMTISDAATNALLHTWTLSDPTDLIGAIGGNRYGWIDYNQFGSLAIDNAELTTAAAVPEPASLALFGVGIAGLMLRRRKAA